MLTLQEKTKLLTWQQVQDHFTASKFVLWEDYAKVMYQSWLAGRNLVVYGKGGFGKSEMTYHFFGLLAQVVPDFSSDLLDCGGADSTKIWAGIKGSELPNFIYNVESSWLASRYIVFEELFDAQLSALVEMKQTLTSGEFRTPLQRYVSKCEWLVCLTNKSKAEVLDSVSEESRNTVDALLQRFPLAYQLQWSAAQLRDPDCWYDLFAKVKPYLSYDITHLVANAMAQAHKQHKSSHDYMSPRSALHLLSTTEAWAAATGQPLTLSHFFSTSWAYPEPVATYFQDQQSWWVDPEPPIPEPEPVVVVELAPQDVLAAISNVDCTALQLRDLQALDMTVRRLVYAYPDHPDTQEAVSLLPTRINIWEMWNDTQYTAPAEVV